MAPQTVRLPDGQTFSVTPVFAGVGFKSHELNMSPHAFPVGWTVVLHTEEGGDDAKARRSAGGKAKAHDDDDGYDGDSDRQEQLPLSLRPRRNVHSFKKPTLQNDSLFISSITNPPSNEYKPAASPTRQIALMLWVSLYWYFQQPEPSPHVEPDHGPNAASAIPVPQHAHPKADWKIHVRRDGVLRGRNLIPKLERMGLIRAADSSVGTDTGDDGDAWADMLVTRSMFWQIPSRLFLFTLQPNRSLSSGPATPRGSRPGSPTQIEASRAMASHGHTRQSSSHSPFPTSHHNNASGSDNDIPGAPVPLSVPNSPSFAVGPYSSTSHLPTYFPPAPLQYTMTNNIRHPFRSKPPRMGEIFYNRFVPSVGRYLSFRVASASPSPVPYLGPVGPKTPEHTHLCTLSDTSLMQMWMSNPRVREFWGEYAQGFLEKVLRSPHAFPAIGLWDGVPFGYFEVYWVREDILGQHLGEAAGDWDRGLHVLVGEEWARGRVPAWLSSLVHWAFATDFRTMSVCLEPRVDNERFLRRLEESGFAKERQVSFPHKQSWVVRLKRENWQGPAL